MKAAMLFTALVCLGCGAQSPTQPHMPTGTVGATIDRDCALPRWGVTSVQVSIDGTVAGSAGPGGSVTKVLPVGPHVVTGRSQNNIAWGGDTVVTTQASPDSIRSFVCVG